MLTYEMQLRFTTRKPAPESSGPYHGNPQTPGREQAGFRNERVRPYDTPRTDIVEALKRVNRDSTGSEPAIYPFLHREGDLSAVVLVRQEPFASAAVEKRLRAFFAETDEPAIRAIRIEELRLCEIKVEACCDRLREAEKAGFIRDASNLMRHLSLELFPGRRLQNADEYRLEESLAIPVANKADALARAGSVMAHPSLTAELERIYCPQNARKFIGHPVHYRIRADSFEAAREITETLTAALCGTGRLESRRVNYCTAIDNSGFYADSWNRMIDRAQGSTLVIDLEALVKRQCSRGYRAATPKETAEHLAGKVLGHRKDTLFIFVMPPEKNTISKNDPTRLLEERLTLVPLFEGEGNGKKALDYLAGMAKDEESRRFIEAEAQKQLSETRIYTATELHRLYDRLSQKMMLHTCYPGYRAFADKMEAAKARAAAPSEGSYEKLQALVGLDSVKTLVDRILAAHKLFQLRKGWGLTLKQGLPHMTFSGNPGSAKTTVARLLAGILKERGLLPEGKFVECGRADLVGQYVGWTAKIVKSKFSEAKGGVLFIDEAYALVDDKRGLFGDEAIHTIVQEMENHREDVLVIFAGYSDRMREFIERNEGLRSRVVFHVEFPDYDEEELTEILKRMATEKGLRLSRGCAEKCRDLFRAARRQKDFGNGRFVRNLLEDAMLRQAERLTAEGKAREITKRMAQTLCAEDFEGDTSAFGVKQKKKRPAGFMAG